MLKRASVLCLPFLRKKAAFESKNARFYRKEMEKMSINNTPAKEKVWMKFYSEEARNTKLPKCTAYQYVRENNKDRLDATALT